jgi:adenine-specific DNA-methyltransferase
MRRDNRIYFGPDGSRTPSLKRFLSEVKQTITPMSIWKYAEVGHSQKATQELKEIFDGEAVFSYPKPVDLVKRCIELYSDTNSIILDSFAGSGVTAHAVLNLNSQDNGTRKFILCEMCDYAETVTAERVRRVMKGYNKGKNKVEGTGGSFDFFELGETIFDNSTGLLNDKADVEQIRQYVWYTETKSAYIDDPNRSNKYLLGTHNFADYYFYYEPEEETVLDWDFLSKIKQRAEQYIIFADRCLLAEEEMQLRNIVFKKIPRDIKRQ